MLKHRLRSGTVALVAIVATALTGPAVLADDRSSPTADPTCTSSGRVLLGDPLTCASPDQPDAERGDTYEPQGKNFPIAGKYGTPAIPPDPKGDNCHPLRGYGSLNLPPPAEVYTDKNGRKIGRSVLSAHNYGGFGGPNAFFTDILDLYINRDGSGGFVGRDLMEGTVDGRTGTLLSWVEGTFDNLRAGGKFVGYTYTIRGMEGLAGIQAKAYFVGVLGKGYEHVAPGLYCFNGFNGMYDNDGKLTG